MALRARTGSARFEVVSLEERILLIEVAKAVGSLRFRRAVVLGVLPVDDDDAAAVDDNDEAASDSESFSEEALELLFEEARSTAVNSSLD